MSYFNGSSDRDLCHLHLERLPIAGTLVADVYTGLEKCVVKLYDLDGIKVSTERWVGPLAMRQCWDYMAELDDKYHEGE